MKFSNIKYQGPLSDHENHDYDFNYKIKPLDSFKDAQEIEREEKLISD